MPPAGADTVLGLALALVATPRPRSPPLRGQPLRSADPGCHRGAAAGRRHRRRLPAGAAGNAHRSGTDAARSSLKPGGRPRPGAGGR